jgi:predicted nuclease of predicted toxin-antitoxin system
MKTSLHVCSGGSRRFSPVLIHVRDIGLKQASDETIWNWAKANSYTIVTTDADFAALSEVRGWPPKVIHLVECDVPLRQVEELLRKKAINLSEFEKNPSTGLLALHGILIGTSDNSSAATR